MIRRNRSCYRWCDEVIIPLTEKNFVRKMIEKFNRLSEGIINHSYRSSSLMDRSVAGTCVHVQHVSEKERWKSRRGGEGERGKERLIKRWTRNDFVINRLATVIRFERWHAWIVNPIDGVIKWRLTNYREPQPPFLRRHED